MAETLTTSSIELKDRKVANNKALWENRIYADLEVLIGPEKKLFQAHRAIVCLHSSFFSAACAGEWIEASTQKVTLPEVEIAAFENVLEYLYHGELDREKLSYGEWAGVMVLADMLAIPRLIEYCKTDFLKWVGHPDTKVELKYVLHFLNHLYLELPELYHVYLQDLTRKFIKAVMRAGMELRESFRELLDAMEGPSAQLLSHIAGFAVVYNAATPGVGKKR